MHIPDGYLSPATCAALYAAATPFWYVALRRVKSLLATRMVPLISLFAAFSFVVMMFNLPLPGGTTGHAVGVTVASIVLGPWSSIIAISVALLIQAVFFGDGGITALGANCFNMAVVGSLVAYGLYRLVAGGATLQSRRRVFAAAIAGYAAVNAAALLAAIEFGIQPIFFHDVTGAPLYAPYRLGVAIPAMMIGHLTIAGTAELILSAGLVAYLQKTNPELLKFTATQDGNRVAEHSVSAYGSRPLWAALAMLLLLTPLGVLAVGKAWGEWSAQDFSSHQTRQEITAASRSEAPPVNTPQGLERLSSLWTAPFPGYAPPIVRSRGFGYMLSGMFGAGVIIAVIMTGGRMASARTRASSKDEG